MDSSEPGELPTFVSQREHPRMALIHPKIDPTGHKMLLTAPGMPQLEVALPLQLGQRLTCRIWKSIVEVAKTEKVGQPKCML